MTLSELIKELQEYEKEYGGDTTVMMIEVENKCTVVQNVYSYPDYEEKRDRLVISG